MVSFNFLDFSSGSVDIQNRRFLDGYNVDNFMRAIANEWVTEETIRDILCLERHFLVDIIPELEEKYQNDAKFASNKAGSSVNNLATPK